MRVIKSYLALLYDGIIITALLLLATLLAVVCHHGKAFAAGEVFFRVYLGMIIFGYFIGCYYFKGQTVGMRAWGVKKFYLFR